jgi:hypothetical protein
MPMGTEAATIGVYLSTPEFIRNYVRSGALSEVARNHRLVAVLPETLQGHPGVQAGNFSAVIPVRVPATVLAVEALLQDARTHRFRTLSSSFLFRHERMKERASRAQFTVEAESLRLRPLRIVKRWKSLHTNLSAVIAYGFTILLWLRNFRSRSSNYWFARTLSTQPMWALGRTFEWFPQRWAGGVARRLQAESVSTVLIPSNAFEPSLRPLLRALRRQKIRSVMLIDNWDNLSSKIILPQLPDHMGVWGEQSRSHAVRIQGMPEQQVHVLGSPRFSAYIGATASRTSIGTSGEVPTGESRVLFAGCSVPFLEVPVLRALDDWAASHSGRRPVIEYRPHPQRHKRRVPDVFNPADFTHVIGDVRTDPIAMSREARSSEGVAGPKLSTYERMFDSYHFVISAPTSLVIEALLNRKQVILLGLDDGIHLTSPSIYLRRSTHFEAVDSLEAVTLVRDLDELRSAMAELVERTADEIRVTDEQLHQVEHFCVADLGGYPRRLLDLVRTVSGSAAAVSH